MYLDSPLEPDLNINEFPRFLNPNPNPYTQYVHDGSKSSNPPQNSPAHSGVTKS